MKFVAILIAIFIIAGWVFYNYNETGQMTLFPKKLSPIEQQIFQLEKKLKKIDREIESLKRQGQSTGMSTAGVQMALDTGIQQEKDELERQIAELKTQLECIP